MAETTTKKTAKNAAKPKAKTVSPTSESVIANPITKKGNRELRSWQGTKENFHQRCYLKHSILK